MPALECAPLCTVGFVSLGCAKNLTDSQVMAGQLVMAGYTLAPSPRDADVVIVNTCAFIKDAKTESIDHILEVCRWKESGVCRGVIVSGCLSQRYGSELLESIPEVDAFIGVDEIDSVSEIVRRVFNGQRGILTISPQSNRLFEPPLPGLSLTGRVFSYIKIAEGCDHACAFCAIPAIRGAFRSRSIASIVNEARALVGAGVREINLVSQDTTSYGTDRADGASLHELLRELNAIEGEFWIRWLYGYPSGITPELLDCMASLDKVCAYIDVPIQHSHPDILKAMLRGGAAESLLDKVRLARRHLPGVALRTTCLVGFPGETDEHFEHLLRFIEEAQFDHVGVFAFSPEDGAVAETLPGRPSAQCAAQRRKRLMKRQRAVVDRIQAARLGGVERVLVESVIEGDDGEVTWVGRSRREAPEADGRIWIDGSADRLEPGSFVNVRMTAADGYDMKGEAF